MKKKIFRILCVIMLCCISLTFVGCLGNPAENYGDEDYNPVEDNEGAISIDLYGTKVLYRPDSYDFNTGSGGTEEQENNYYGQYAYYVMNAIFNIFGISSVDSRDMILYAPQFTAGGDKEENLPYLYDSIRYKIDTIGHVTLKNNNGTTEKVDYYIVGANFDSAWNWSWSYDTTGIEAYIVNNSTSSHDPQPVIIKGNIYNYYSTIDNENQSEPNFEGMGGLQFNEYYAGISSNYRTYFVSSSNEPSDYDAYSEFTKALEYVIYSYALDLEPNSIEVTHTDTAPYYQVTVAGYPADTQNNKTSVDVALEDIKATFNKLGAYVGLVDRQITKIKNWILENVIGSNAQSNGDYLRTYNSVTEIIDENGDVSYNFGNATNSTELGRDYENVLDRLITGVCEDVTIGGGEEGGTTIDERFLASELTEYVGNTFLVSDDSNFPVYSEDMPAGYIPPLEYQSVTIMPKTTNWIQSIYIALKYDADEDGTEENVYNADKYIDIQVDLNYYNHANRAYKTLTSDIVRVFDGPYDINYLITTDGQGTEDGNAPAGHASGVSFEDIGSMLPNNEYGQYLPVGAFNTAVAGGVLNTDVAQSNYDGSIIRSQSPIILTGSTEAKNWYSIVENEELIDGKSYLSGRLNYTLFDTDPNGCDYLEITYKVLKQPGDADTNYKFYTGIALILNADTPPTPDPY